MGSALGLFLALLSVAVVILPFLRKTSGGTRTPSSSSEEFQVKRHTVYDNMKLLSLEYELGHISHEEYKEIYLEHRREAAGIVRSQELLMDDIEDLDSELEQEISKVKCSVNDSSLQRNDCC